MLIWLLFISKHRDKERERERERERESTSIHFHLSLRYHFSSRIHSPHSSGILLPYLLFRLLILLHIFLPGFSPFRFFFLFVQRKKLREGHPPEAAEREVRHAQRAGRGCGHGHAAQRKRHCQCYQQPRHSPGRPRQTKEQEEEENRGESDGGTG